MNFFDDDYNELFQWLKLFPKMMNFVDDENKKLCWRLWFFLKMSNFVEDEYEEFCWWWNIEYDELFQKMNMMNFSDYDMLKITNCSKDEYDEFCWWWWIAPTMINFSDDYEFYSWWKWWNVPMIMNKPKMKNCADNEKNSDNNELFWWWLSWIAPTMNNITNYEKLCLWWHIFPMTTNISEDENDVLCRRRRIVLSMAFFFEIDEFLLCWRIFSRWRIG